MPSGIDMAAVFGPAKGGKKPPAAGADPLASEAPTEPAPPAEAPLPPDFEAAASEFLDDTLSPEERMHSLKRAIEACVAAREGGEY